MSFQYSSCKRLLTYSLFNQHWLWLLSNESEYLVYLFGMIIIAIVISLSIYLLTNIFLLTRNQCPILLSFSLPLHSPIFYFWIWFFFIVDFKKIFSHEVCAKWTKITMEIGIELYILFLIYYYFYHEINSYYITSKSQNLGFPKLTFLKRRN